MQGTLFDRGTRASKPSGNDLPGQSRLVFRGGTLGESRGTMDATWLECVLVIARRERMSTPTMVELQEAWNHKLSASDSVDRIKSGREKLSRPKKIELALKQIANGEPIRKVSMAHGIPVTTLRRALGRVPKPRKCKICGKRLVRCEDNECYNCSDDYSYYGKHGVEQHAY